MVTKASKSSDRIIEALNMEGNVLAAVKFMR